MDKEILAIIDTAVKIGLGALISGLGGYLVTSSNQSHEDKKELRNRKLNIIESAAEHTHEYINSFKDLLSVIDGVRKTYPELEEFQLQNESHLSAWRFICDYDKKFCDARVHAEHALSKLYLVGLGDVAIHFDGFQKLDQKVRDIVLFNQKLPEKDVVDSWKDEIKDKARAFFNDLSKHYKT